MLYCEAELCLAASTFGRGGILSENRKDGKVTVHSAKDIKKFDSIVGRSANHSDQINLGVAACLRSSIYGGVPRATSLTTTVSGGPDADDCAYVEWRIPYTAISASYDHFLCGEPYVLYSLQLLVLRSTNTDLPGARNGSWTTRSSKT